MTTSQKVQTLTGNGSAGFAGDGGPATAALIAEPFGLAIGPDGCLYFCDLGNHRIRKIDRGSSTIVTVVGNGEAGNNGDGGRAIDAAITEPYEIRFAADGSLFFVDMKAQVVRRVAPDQQIETVAGTGEAGFGGDGGSATRACLNQPHSIEFDGDGQLYIADIGNHRIRRVNLDAGDIETFAGTGNKGATVEGARISNSDLFGPRAIAFTKNGDMIIALREGNTIWRVEKATGTLRHIAGNGTFGWAGDGGPATAASLAGPKGITLSDTGDLFLADTESHTIRCIRSGVISTVMGDGTRHDGPDGAADQCGLARPHGVFVADGVLYVGDSDNHRVRMMQLA